MSNFPNNCLAKCFEIFQKKVKQNQRIIPQKPVKIYGYRTHYLKFQKKKHPFSKTLSSKKL